MEDRLKSAVPSDSKASSVKRPDDIRTQVLAILDATQDTLDVPSVMRRVHWIVCVVHQREGWDKSQSEDLARAWVRTKLQTVEKNPGPEPASDTRQPVAEDFARQVVDVLVEFLQLFGFEAAGFQRADSIAQWTEWIQDSGNWMKTTKYKLSAFYTFAMSDELVDKQLPENPHKTTQSHPLHLLGGRGGRYFHRMIRRNNALRDSFLSSVLLVKTGMPRPDKKFLAESAKKMVEAIVTQRKPIWIEKPVPIPVPGPLPSSSSGTFAQLEEEVKKIVQETFGGVRFTGPDLLENFITPSFSANYIRSRKGFGTFGELMERGMLRTRPRADLRLRRIAVEEYIGLDQNPAIELSGFTAARDQFLHTYFDALHQALEEPPIAEAVPLAEALKVRVITKGPPLTQFVLAPLQKFMWKTLKSHPVFKLIGEPISESDLLPRLGYLFPGEAWLSGDYSDATNQLNPRLSELAWDTICTTCEVPNVLWQLGRRVLTGHLLVVDKKKGLISEQAWGQLMGSIISFPILCVVNAAVCRLSIKHDLGREVRLLDCPLLVNGDDCLFKCGPAGYSAWKTFGTMAGLSPSVGKVYFSKSFCNINSTFFRYNASRERPFVRIPVIRLGLVFGLKRSLAEIEQEQPKLNLLGNGVEWDSSLGARHRALMFECPEECKERVHKKFLTKNSQLLASASEYLMPWYVPECYGGVGLQPLPGYWPSRKDQLIVHAMVHQGFWNNGRYNPPVPTVWKGAAKTKIHQVALARLKHAVGQVPTRYVEVGSSVKDGLDSPSLDSWVLYQLPDQVLTGDEGREAEACLRQNRKVWKWYLQHFDKFASMKLRSDHELYLEPARRLVHDVLIVERHLERAYPNIVDPLQMVVNDFLTLQERAVVELNDLLEVPGEPVIRNDSERSGASEHVRDHLAHLAQMRNLEEFSQELMASTNP